MNPKVEPMAQTGDNQKELSARGELLDRLAISYQAQPSLATIESILATLRPFLTKQASRCAALSRATRPIEVEDALQEASLAVLDALSTWKEGRASFWTWVHQKVRAALYSLTRLDRKKSLFEAQIDELPETLAAPSDPLDPAIRSLIREALNALPDREALVIQRCDIEGHTQAEVAREMGLSDSRVHQIRQSALARLRLRLTWLEIDPDQTGFNIAGEPPPAR